MDGFTFDDDFFDFLDYGSDSKTTTSSSNDDSNGVFGWIDDIAKSGTDLFGGVLDTIEGSSIADGFMKNYFNKKKSVEKVTDQTTVQPDSILSGVTQTFKSIPTPYIIGGSIASILAIALLIKKA